jgi:regulator of protease activity HflC (stomatin/prohibitin superfamily)
MFLIGILVGIVVWAVFALSRAYFVVEEGFVAVLTTFGASTVSADGGGRLKTYGPGLHYKLPWQKAIQVRVMEQNLELSGENGGRVAMTDDGTVLRFDSIMRYQPLEAELATFLFGLRAPLEHITGLFTCLLRNEIANFRLASENSHSLDSRAAESARSIEPRGPGVFPSHGGSYALIRRERQRLNHQIETFSRDRIGARYGVQFNAVDLVDILPPDELADALNAVINAQTECEADFFRAEGDCQQRVLAAERGVEIARIRAQAIRSEILKLGGFLQELHQQGTLRDYVARRRSEVLSDARSLVLKEEGVAQ